jgi:D-hexose-6-phosphate mutarotase
VREVYGVRVQRGPASIDLPASVTLEEGPGGLARLVVRDERHGTAEVYLHGAHVTGWTPPGGAPVLWMSPRSRFSKDAAIRGGVPICFPWFSAGPDGDRAPAHGYARLRDWELRSAVEGDDGIVLTLALAPHEDDAPLEEEYRVSVGRVLGLALEVRNTGEVPVAFEEALHTYLAVADVRAIALEGLAGSAYLDRNGGPAPVVQEEEVVRFAAETDRIYVGSEATVVVDDPGAARRIAVHKEGSVTTVVWNPWTAKASAMADVGPDAWPGFVCVETANVLGATVTLAPGQSHEMAAWLEVLPRG